MAGLYSDEDFPLPAVEELRRLGHDVLTAYEAGQANQSIPDDLVLAFAHNLQRAQLTHNRRDFMRLHRAGFVHSGIIACTANSDPIQLARIIHATIKDLPDLAGQLIRIYRPAN
jgi:hypothetical protein